MVYFHRKIYVRATKNIEIEVVIPTLAAQSKPADVAIHESLLYIQNTPDNLRRSADVVETKKEMHQEIFEKNKFRQLEDGDGIYEPTPKVLTEMSAKIFSMFYPTDIKSSILPLVEVKDIESAFATGDYPTLSILKALKLEGPFSGYVWTDDGVPRLKLNWNLRIDNNIDPVQGTFSFQVDGVEKSCNATTSGPLKNISLLTEDKGAILVMSCDKSFYVQLYRSNALSIIGSYFEKQQDGKYKSRDFVMCLRGTAY